MASTLTLYRKGTAPRYKSGHPRAYLATSTGIKLVLPFAPVEVDHDGWADPFETLDRPGRLPLVRRSGDGLPTLSFAVTIAYQDHQDSVEGVIARLRSIAYSGARVTVGGMSVHELGPWRMTGCQVTTTARQYGSNRITGATASLSFLRDSDVTVVPKHTGPATGGHKPTKPKAHPVNRYYVMRRGDTLSGVAHKMYGHAALWPRIATASHIRNTRTIKVGTRLTIPPL